MAHASGTGAVLVNLGFSGACEYEPELALAVAAIDASCYVPDPRTSDRSTTRPPGTEYGGSHLY